MNVVEYWTGGSPCNLDGSVARASMRRSLYDCNGVVRGEIEPAAFIVLTYTITTRPRAPSTSNFDDIINLLISCCEDSLITIHIIRLEVLKETIRKILHVS